MSLIRATLTQVVNGEQTTNIFDWWRPGSGFFITNEDCEAIGQYFISDVLPALNAFQHPGVENMNLSVLGVRNLVSVSFPLSGFGTNVAVGGSIQNLKSLAYRYRMQVDESLDPATGAPLADQSHRIARGTRYFAGVGDDVIANGRYTGGVGYTALYAALTAALINPITAPDAGDDWVFVVWGQPIMDGLTEVRPECVAPVLNGTVAGVSNLKTRQPSFA